MVIGILFKRLHNPRISKNNNQFKWLFGSCIIGAFAGWKWGDYWSTHEDMEKYIIKFENEDRIYQEMKNTNNPVFMYYYIPGEWYSLYFRKVFLETAKEHNDKVIFTYINCNKHFDVCRNKEIRAMPRVQLWKSHDIGGARQTEVINFEKDLSHDGIKAFFQEHNILPINDVREGFYNNIMKTYFKSMKNKSEAK